jgi:glycerol-3-phosphate acyltransferase PlsY
MHLLSATQDTVIEVLWDLRYWVIGKLALDENGAALVTLLGALICVILPYLMGSVNPAILFSKLFYHDDIRTHGSGNAGTTNMLRTYGKKAAVCTILADFGKAVLATLLGKLILGVDGAAIAGFFVAFGHMFPIFYRFHGGKGVACFAMVALVIDPMTFLGIFFTFAVVLLGTRYVSLASVMAAFLFPMFMRAFANEGLNVAMAVLGACFVVFMHRENLKRLVEGKESKLDFSQFKSKGKKKKAEPSQDDQTGGEEQ